MGSSALYIPTRAREAFAVKAAAAALKAAPDLPLYVVTEQQYKAKLARALREAEVAASPVALDHDRGIGAARAGIIEHAASQGHSSIAQIDDDQVISGDVAGWLALAERPDVVSIGAWKPRYELLYANTRMVAELEDRKLWLTSTGNIAVALNVANVLKVGNYQASLRCLEDDDLHIRALASLGIPWYLYPGATAASQIPHRESHVTGGVSSRGSYGRLRFEAHRVLRAEWPDYISPIRQPYRVSWKRLTTDFTVLRNWPLENIYTAKPWDWNRLPIQRTISILPKMDEMRKLADRAAPTQPGSHRPAAP